jgi:membrane protease YdiL (CAAX protease family)
MTRWLRAHPVAGYCLLAFGISYLVGMPLLMVGSGLLPTRWSLAHAYLPRIGVTYGPAVAALLLAWLTGAPATARELLRGVLPRRRDIPLTLGILLAGAATSGIALVAAGFPAFQLLGTVRDHAGTLAAHLVLQLVLIALGEELGWRGWLQPTLAARTTRLRAALGVGAIWALWHAPALAQGAVRGGMLLVGALGLSVLFAALWAFADRRPYAAVVAHATVNAPMFFWEQVALDGGPPDGRVVTAWYTLQAAYAGAALVLVAAAWRWWRERESKAMRGVGTAVPGTGYH